MLTTVELFLSPACVFPQGYAECCTIEWFSLSFQLEYIVSEPYMNPIEAEQKRDAEKQEYICEEGSLS